MYGKISNDSALIRIIRNIKKRLKKDNLIWYSNNKVRDEYYTKAQHRLYQGKEGKEFALKNDPRKVLSKERFKETQKKDNRYKDENFIIIYFDNEIKRMSGSKFDATSHYYFDY